MSNTLRTKLMCKNGVKTFSHRRGGGIPVKKFSEGEGGGSWAGLKAGGLGPASHQVRVVRPSLLNQTVLTFNVLTFCIVDLVSLFKKRLRSITETYFLPYLRNKPV